MHRIHDFQGTDEAQFEAEKGSTGLSKQELMRMKMNADKQANLSVICASFYMIHMVKYVLCCSESYLMKCDS